MTKKILSLFLIVIFVFLVTGCGSLTSLMGGVDKDASKSVDKEEKAEPAGNALGSSADAAEQEQQEVEESASGLTGSTVAEVEEMEEEPESTTYTVKMTAEGFGPDKLYIKVGDTVVWKNTRSGAINKAMIIGVRECKEVRSGFLKPGESFSWTFDKPITCTLADGIMTKEESKIFVEE